MQNDFMLKGEGALRISIFQEGEWFVATCPSLRLSSFGATKEEAHRKFQEVLEGFLEVCLENGTLKEVLLECGWRLKRGAFVPPHHVSDKKIPVGSLMESLNEKHNQYNLQRT